MTIRLIYICVKKYWNYSKSEAKTNTDIKWFVFDIEYIQ